MENSEKNKFRGLFGGEWYEELREILDSNYWRRLGRKIAQDRFYYEIYPEKHSTLLFKAFLTTPLSKVKVVILGQDPYHDGSYDGYAFSNGGKQKSRLSPSLVNIFKEIEDDVYDGLKLDQDPNLERWAKQGVLLINTAHTVRKGNPGWYLEDWMPFTIKVMEILVKQEQPIVFMLWGRKAEDIVTTDSIRKLFFKAIGENKLPLRTSHPSPFSAHMGFFGCKHFSQCNEHLERYGRDKIEW
jgi:uracil-DNA glycosylase